jgi:hypothetical protein
LATLSLNATARAKPAINGIKIHILNHPLKAIKGEVKAVRAGTASA